MNTDNFKLRCGNFVLGLRVHVPKSEMQNHIYTSPAIMGVMLFAELLEARCAAEGVKCSTGIGGELSNFKGFITVSDLRAAVPVIKAVLQNSGMSAFAELFVWDPNERIFRPLDPGAHEPFDYDQTAAELTRVLEALKAKLPDWSAPQ
jgi:hypothetical protein